LLFIKLGVSIVATGRACPVMLLNVLLVATLFAAVLPTTPVTFPPLD